MRSAWRSGNGVDAQKLKTLRSAVRLLPTLHFRTNYKEGCTATTAYGELLYGFAIPARYQHALNPLNSHELLGVDHGQARCGKYVREPFGQADTL